MTRTHRSAALGAALTLALVGPALTSSPALAADPSPVVVTTDNETPALYDDELGGNASGDDPAIWVDPTDSHNSIVIVTAKEGGLRVYDLDSAELQSLSATAAPRADGVDGRYNNVDIAYAVRLGGRTVDLAVVTDRYNDQLRFFVIDPAGARADSPLREVTAPDQEFIFNTDRDAVDDEHTAYGVAVWQPPQGGTFAAVTQEGETRLATVRLVEQDGLIGYTDVTTTTMPATFALPDGTTWTPCEEPGIKPQFEGMTVDQRTGTLFAAQEDVGLWSIPLPLTSRTPKAARLIDRTTDFGIHDTYNAETEECEPVDPEDRGFGGSLLTADAEGVDLYYGKGATGYVIVSSQGDDMYAVYDRQGAHRAVGSFRIKGVDGVDDVNGSDGLAVTNRPVGDYQRGLLVTHDEPETGANVDPERDATNFSYVQWADIADSLGLTVSTKASNDPRFR